MDQLSDLTSAEQQLTKALPDMAAAATGSNLKQAFADHLKETELHLSRLEESAKILGAPDKAKTCLAMKGLIAEGAEAAEAKLDADIRDVALLGAARRVEHYEIAAYKSTASLAAAAGETEVADLLQQTLTEECDADKRLASIAETALEAGRKNLRGSVTVPAETRPNKPAKTKR